MKIILTVIIILVLTSCSGSVKQRSMNTNKVEDTIKNQMLAEDNEKDFSKNKLASDKNSDKDKEESAAVELPEPDKNKSTDPVTGEMRAEPMKKDECSEIDYDLTKMNKDVVYATVFSFITDPKEYEGCMIKISGLFAIMMDPETEELYRYCLIRDAMECCQQGIEFVWGDGKHKESEYPSEGAEIVVQGVFESYECGEGPDGTPIKYFRLKNATMTVI